MFNPYDPTPSYSGMWGNQYQQRLAQLQQGGSTPPSLIRVTGIDGAKAYQMPPNSTVALFDASEDFFFVKSTDGAGFPTIRTFKFTPVENAQPPADYVTRQEYDQLKEMILNVQQLIWKPTSGSAAESPKSTPVDGQVPRILPADGGAKP